MIQLHEQIAAQAYWDVPSVPFESFPYGPLRSLGNLALSGGAANAVYRDCRLLGYTTRSFIQGEEIASFGRGVIKAVEDTRFTPTDSAGFAPTGEETFDETAAQMVELQWYRGRAVEAQVETNDGVVHIMRRVLYLTEPVFGDWYLARDSSLLDFDVTGFLGKHVQPRPLGHSIVHHSPEGTVEQKISAAECIRPAVRRPARRPKLRVPVLLPSSVARQPATGLA